MGCAGAVGSPRSHRAGSWRALLKHGRGPFHRAAIPRKSSAVGRPSGEPSDMQSARTRVSVAVSSVEATTSAPSAAPAAANSSRPPPPAPRWSRRRRGCAGLGAAGTRGAVGGASLLLLPPLSGGFGDIRGGLSVGSLPGASAVSIESGEALDQRAGSSGECPLNPAAASAAFKRSASSAAGSWYMHVRLRLARRSVCAKTWRHADTLGGTAMFECCAYRRPRRGARTEARAGIASRPIDAGRNLQRRHHRAPGAEGAGLPPTRAPRGPLRVGRRTA